MRKKIQWVYFGSKNAQPNTHNLFFYLKYTFLYSNLFELLSCSVMYTNRSDIIIFLLFYFIYLFIFLPGPPDPQWTGRVQAHGARSSQAPYLPFKYQKPLDHSGMT